MPSCSAPPGRERHAAGSVTTALVCSACVQVALVLHITSITVCCYNSSILLPVIVNLLLAEFIN